MHPLQRLFRGRSSKVQAALPPVQPGGMSDHVFHSMLDVLSGFEFVATLQIRTPLSVLERHGERHPGPPSALPNYASIADGIWIPQTKSWDEFAGPKAPKPLVQYSTEKSREIHEQRLVANGFSTEKTKEIASDYEPGQMASDIGPITPAKYLPFLKSFRRIAESSISVPEKLQALDDLHRSDPAFESIWSQLQKSYEDFPNCFFYLQLTAIPGVGSKTARRLFQAGLLDIGAVRAASDEALQAIPGIGQKLLKTIRAP
jgi:hypothetical protein